jgi:hypothetical protein
LVGLSAIAAPESHLDDLHARHFLAALVASGVAAPTRIL